MDIHHIIIWVVCLSCVLTIIGAVRAGDRMGWVIVASTVLTVTILLLSFAPKWAILVGGSLWFVLLFLPSLLTIAIERLVYQQSYANARKLAKVLRFLHPVDRAVSYPEMLRSLEMAQIGNMIAAKEILDRYQDIKTPHGRYATISLYRMNAQWQELLVWIRDRIPKKLLLSDRDLMMNYLRALGETGDRNGLLQGLKKLEKIVSQTRDNVSLNTIRMTALAFCGEMESVKFLLSNQLRVYSSEISQFWIATAEMSAGMETEAREKFKLLGNSKDASLQKAIAWRLSQTEVSADLTDESQQILVQMKLDIQQEERYGSAMQQTGKKAYVTYTLIGLNVFIFAIQMAYGRSDNIQNLYRLGGLVPLLVWQGEWWRLLTAMFLHINFLHLLFNMLGLQIMGEFVEARLGTRRYLIAYFFSGLGSMLFITILTVFFHYHPRQITVGASGAIMGIIGATGAILLKGWLYEKSKMAVNRLRSVLFIVGLQAAIDLSTPQISFVAHASGLVLGFLIGFVLAVNPKNNPSKGRS